MNREMQNNCNKHHLEQKGSPSFVVCKKPLTVNQNVVLHYQGFIGFDHTSSKQPRSEAQGQGRQTAFVRGRD